MGQLGHSVGNCAPGCTGSLQHTFAGKGSQFPAGSLTRRVSHVGHSSAVPGTLLDGSLVEFLSGAIPFRPLRVRCDHLVLFAPRLISLRPL